MSAYTEADAELVTAAINDASGYAHADDSERWAPYVLRALADAGRLTPADAEEQWQFQITDLQTGYSGPWMPKRAVVDVEAIRALAEPYVGDAQFSVKFRHRPLAPWVAVDGTP